VAPEDRGRGIGRLLMTALLDEIAAHGYPLSVLYPATMPLYRSLGWELAGSRYTAVIPARSLFGLEPPDPAPTRSGLPAIRRAGPDDVEAVLAVTVAGGKGSLTPATADLTPLTPLTAPAQLGPARPAGPAPLAEPVALGPRGLAALYAGTPLVTLRQAGPGLRRRTGGRRGPGRRLRRVALHARRLLSQF